jgi:acetoacetyl-CoA reductase
MAGNRRRPCSTRLLTRGVPPVSAKALAQGVGRKGKAAVPGDTGHNEEVSAVFEGHVGLVTGGTRGIGAAITTMLAKNGARAAAGYSKGKDAADELIRTLEADGAQVSVHQGRVDKPEDCQRVVSEVLARFGRIDFLVNNAGITVDKTVRKMTFEDWRNVLDVNLFGAFCMTKAVLEHMIERGSGRIVNISSVIGETGNVGQANYAASKAGLFGLTKSLALEMARRGITVNVVAPGFIATEMVAQMPQNVLDAVVEKIPQRRLGRPDEVARVVQFLLEDESSYITGAVYTINGGLDM